MSESPTPTDYSGRASPAVNTRPPRRQLEDETHKQDKNYRRYASNIERALASFDSARLEWPDYISFLGRLLKAIQGHPTVIESLPHKHLVANRLAQCLRPSLPSGVHQKALEVYSYIFSMSGIPKLALDLTIYLPGLSAVLGFASLSLRPAYLTLLETYILPIDGSQLRHPLKALILSLLPGLEEENSEDFERTLQLFDNLKGAVNEHGRSEAVNISSTGESTSGDEYFWQCFFLASMSNTYRRQGALTYLAKRLPRLNKLKRSSSSSAKEGLGPGLQDRLSPAAESAVSPEPGLLVRCLISGLEDEQVLVQRGFLDLLLSHLPLDSPVLVSRVDASDLVRLVGAATGVVARRDMSLNRRLWSWFLVSDNTEGVAEDADSSRSPESSKTSNRNQKSSKELAYFERYGADTLQQSIIQMLSERHIQPTKRARPFRICLSLMDRWEIGSAIVPRIFLPAMENIFDYNLAAPDQDFQEVLRSANSFFDGVESDTIWGKIAELASQALSPTQTDAQKIQLALFIVNNFQVREEEMLANHTPLVALLLLARIHELDKSVSGDKVHAIDDERLVLVLPLVEHLASSLPDRKSVKPKLDTEDAVFDTSEATRPAEIVKSITALYSASKRNRSPTDSQLSRDVIDALLIKESANLVIRVQQRKLWSDSLVLSTRVFTSLLSKLPATQAFDLECLVVSTKQTLTAWETQPKDQVTAVQPPKVPFPALNALASMLTAICSVPDCSLGPDTEGLIDLVATLVRYLWSHLSPSCPRYHLESVRCMWQLEELLPTEYSIEASITSLFAASRKASHADLSAIEQARRFSVLWTHTSLTASQPSRPNHNLWSRSFSVASDLQSLKPRKTVNNQTKLYRPLLLLLNSCDGPDTELQAFTRAWLDGLPNASRIFDLLVSKIRECLAESVMRMKHATSKSMQTQLEHQNRDGECLYYVRRLHTLLVSKSVHIWAAMLEEHTAIPDNSGEAPYGPSILLSMTNVCLEILNTRLIHSFVHFNTSGQPLEHASASLMLLALNSPVAGYLENSKLEQPLITLLRSTLQSPDACPSIQVSLLDLLYAALRVRGLPPPDIKWPKVHRRATSMDVVKVQSAPSDLSQENNKSKELTLDLQLSNDLVKCIQDGLQSAKTVLVLEHWIQFLIDILPPLAANLFQCIIPLVEAFCKRIREIFQGLNATFGKASNVVLSSPEPSLIALLNGLEFLLAAGHEQMAVEDAKSTQQLRSPEPTQGFFGNVVAGVFSADAPKGRPAAANTRLTVILCFQDTLRICLTLWSWGAYGDTSDQPDPTCLASFLYVSQRLRNKARRILDRMFTAEGLECLETLIAAWTRSTGKKGPSSIISLLHVLDASTPKQAMPAIFNAIYSRTSPASLEAQRMSTLTSDLTDTELAQFLLEYTRSLDDDAMDEIWTDCMTFLRDVLGNPLPHAPILPALLQFLIILAEKVDKTNFGEQRKMRRELGDLCLRLLTATFTTRPGGMSFEVNNSDLDLPLNGGSIKGRSARRKDRHADLVNALTVVIPKLATVIPDADRLMAAVSNILSNLITPLLHAKTFPDNLRPEYLVVWQQITQLSQASKVWRKELLDIFMHPKLFSTSPATAFDHLSSLIRQIAIVDKDRLSDLCVRINPPTSAGIMFGVGAAAARTESDKKTQLILRRIAYLVLAADEDYAVIHMPLIEEKLTELLTATVASSPSAATRAEVFMLLRAIVLRTTTIHLAALWPLVTMELQRAVLSVVPRSPDYELYNVPSVFQACKLLDLLIVISPDEFQMQEWLFITDTIEAVYRPEHWEPIALADDIADELGVSDPAMSLRKPVEAPSEDPMSEQTMRHNGLMLTNKDNLVEVSKEEFVAKVLQPFFAQLSIHSYEASYSLKSPDWEGCKRALVEDLFDDTTIVG